MSFRRLWTKISKKDPMIFGFNTDVKHGENVYHVQSEARQSEFLFQTQAFVRGRCIGNRATSYAATTADPYFSDKHQQAMLRDRHPQIQAEEGRLNWPSIRNHEIGHQWGREVLRIHSQPGFPDRTNGNEARPGSSRVEPRNRSPRRLAADEPLRW